MSKNKSTKTIVIAINDLLLAGGQKTAVREANELCARGYDVYLLTTREYRKRKNFLPLLELPHERIIHIPARSPWDIRAIRSIGLFFKKTKPDVIISNLFLTNTLVRLAKLFFYRSARVYVREGNMPQEKSWLVRIVDFFLSFVTERIIVNAEALKSAFKWFVPRRKVIVLLNGIDEEFFGDCNILERAKRRAELGLSAETCVGVIVATLNPQKGHQYLFRAIADMDEQSRESFHLLVVGEGRERGALEKKAKELGIEEQVSFMGAVGDVKDKLCIADMFILPTLFEGMPNALLEAMALELPVVATPVGGIPEVVEDEKTGLLVPLRDSEALGSALKALCADESLRKHLGENARQSTRHLTWRRHADKLIKIIT